MIKSQDQVINSHSKLMYNKKVLHKKARGILELAEHWTDDLKVLSSNLTGDNF